MIRSHRYPTHRRRHLPLRAFAFLVIAVASLVAPPASPSTASPAEGLVRVAMLRYGKEHKTSVCFSNAFMRVLAHETDIRLDGSFDAIDLDSEQLFNFPFAIMTGEGAFELSDAEINVLRRYVRQGGFLLASAGCSNPAWNESFTKLLKVILPDDPEHELPLTHPVFQTVYEIKEFQSKKAHTKVRVMGIELDGRLCIVHSPEGLNDTQNAGGGCCCCGGNEIRNAKFINANILAYALMH
ncbi:MAG TPA: DUF4159 domain-containing protein [Phycisphaerales bacterium]|nr:DUF4159 domain-containing protein [Phycisphaerales bacterium]